MLSIHFFKRAPLPSWTYLWLSVEGSRDAWNNEEQFKSTMNAFQAKIREVGIDANNYSDVRITLKPDYFETQIDNGIGRFVSHASRLPPTLLLVIIPHVDTPSTIASNWHVMSNRVFAR
jgi:hypothetical protein